MSDMQTSDSLLPCPFCGADGESIAVEFKCETGAFESGESIEWTDFYVACRCCGARGPASSLGTDAGRTVDDVRESWNLRPSHDSDPPPAPGATNDPPRPDQLWPEGVEHPTSPPPPRAGNYKGPTVAKPTELPPPPPRGLTDDETVALARAGNLRLATREIIAAAREVVIEAGDSPTIKAYGTPIGYDVPIEFIDRLRDAIAEFDSLPDPAAPTPTTPQP